MHVWLGAPSITYLNSSAQSMLSYIPFGDEINTRSPGFKHLTLNLSRTEDAVAYHAQYYIAELVGDNA